MKIYSDETKKVQQKRKDEWKSTGEKRMTKKTPRQD